MMHENTINKGLTSEGEETSKSSSLTSFFMKSSKSWVKAVTADNESPPDGTYLNKLVAKAWSKPFKISKFFKSLLNRPTDKTVISLKCLFVLHKYIFAGPKQVFNQETGVNQFLESLMLNWASPAKSKKDKMANNYFKTLINQYSSVLTDKFNLNLQTRCLGN